MAWNEKTTDTIKLEARMGLVKCHVKYYYYILLYILLYFLKTEKTKSMERASRRCSLGSLS